MHAELKAKWVEALRSGKYQQDKHCLRTDSGFCCLGVLCDVVDSSRWNKRAIGSTAPLWVHGVSANYLPNDLRVGAGLTNHTGRLMGMNDDGKSFAQIADYIEANIPVDNEFNPDPAKSVDGSIDPYLS